MYSENSSFDCQEVIQWHRKVGRAKPDDRRVTEWLEQEPNHGVGCVRARRLDPLPGGLRCVRRLIGIDI